MKQITKNFSLYFLVSFILGILITPQSMAQMNKERQLEQKVQALEAMLHSVKDELQQLREETARTAANKAAETKAAEVAAEAARQDASVAKAQAIAAKEAASNVAGQKAGRPKHMVFFRGGFTHAREKRDGSSIRSDVAPVGVQDQADRDGWYTGAGFDFNLTDDVWGLLPRTSVYAELMFEYKNFSDHVQGNALANNPTLLVGDVVNPRSVTVSQFTLTASPKIKFFEGSKIRPWIIPMGFALHVVSPTTESITYLIPGVQFGAGVDYNIWKNFYVGIDGRYQLSAGKSDGVKVDGMTAGGYFGIGF